MTSDGRAITPDVEAGLEHHMKMVQDWLVDEMIRRRKAIDREIFQGNLSGALRLQIEAECLLRMSQQAIQGAFLPKDLRPCVDGAGNRGNHLGFVKISDGGISPSPALPLVCAFCGRR